LEFSECNYNYNTGYIHMQTQCPGDEHIFYQRYQNIPRAGNAIATIPPTIGAWSEALELSVGVSVVEPISIGTNSGASAGSGASSDGDGARLSVTGDGLGATGAGEGDGFATGGDGTGAGLASGRGGGEIGSGSLGGVISGDGEVVTELLGAQAPYGVTIVVYTASVERSAKDVLTSPPWTLTSFPAHLVQPYLFPSFQSYLV
jgi:hypothetical protein